MTKRQSIFPAGKTKATGMLSLTMRAAFFAVCAAAEGQTPNGHLTGKVADASGRGVANATVVVNIRSVSSGAFTPFSAVVKTAPDGSFAVSGMPAGTFDVCPQLPGSDLLPTCTWQRAPSVTVAAGQSVLAPTIGMSSGVHVPIRVNDLAGLTTAGTSQAGVSLSVETVGPLGPPIPTIVTSKDATGHNRDALIPFDTQVHIAVFSKALALTGPTGAAVDKLAGTSIPVLIPAGHTATQITLTITGVNP